MNIFIKFIAPSLFQVSSIKGLTFSLGFQGWKLEKRFLQSK